MNWTKSDYGSFDLIVPIKMWEGEDGKGEYEIHIVKRPSYCDRGDWLIYVGGYNDLDQCDGFPRYFFGNENQVKLQMETWLNRRQAYKDVFQQSGR